MPSEIPPMTPDDEIDGGELKEWERKAIRKIVRDQARMDWLWATLRIWSRWAAASIVGAYAVYEVVLKFLKKSVP